MNLDVKHNGTLTNLRSFYKLDVGESGGGYYIRGYILVAKLNGGQTSDYAKEVSYPLFRVGDRETGENLIDLFTEAVESGIKVLDLSTQLRLL